MQGLLQREKNANSFVKDLDTRIKLLLCFTGSICTLLLSSPKALSVLFIGAALLAYAVSSLRTLLVSIFAASCMLLVTFFFTYSLSFFIPMLASLDIVKLAAPYLRMLIMVMLLIPLAFSTPIHELMRSLGRLHLPAFIHIPLTIGIRFIPTFVEDCKQIRVAARLRPSRGFISWLRGFFVPLVFRVFSSSDDLAIAAELKGISPTRPVPRGEKKSLSKSDLYILALSILCIVCAVLVQLADPVTYSIRS